MSGIIQYVTLGTENAETSAVSTWWRSWILFREFRGLTQLLSRRNPPRSLGHRGLWVSLPIYSVLEACGTKRQEDAAIEKIISVAHSLD